LKRGDRKEHEESGCSKRPFGCPYVGSDCNFEGTAPAVARHLRVEHKVTFVDHDDIDIVLRSDENYKGYLQWQRLYYYAETQKFLLFVAERHQVRVTCAF
jgi:predicted small metal-binding protein